MSPELRSILACPCCRNGLTADQDALRCGSCATSFTIVRGVPVFLAEPPEIMSAEHQSNPLGAEFEETLRRGDSLTLHLGAGATVIRFPNCIEFERKIFRHTDVVGDAHALPFRENVFDQVFAFNVFEHLRQPTLAAGEIHRVLKPGGALALHTAFLQSLHEAPHHYYNATEYGVREWFADFEIEKCEVSGNFSPGVMLGFLAASLLETLRESGLPKADQAQIAETRIVQWAQFWHQKSDPPPGFDTLLALPQEFQKRVAAGFEVLARKPNVA